VLERILVVGGGSAGTRHAINAKKLLPSSEVWLYSRRNNLNNNLTDIKLISDFSNAIKIKPNVVIVANEATAHIETAEIFAREGAHLFIEKPLSVSTRAVSGLLEICRSNEVRVGVGYNLRFSSSLKFFRTKLIRGDVGVLLSFNCQAGQFLPSWRKDVRYEKSVSAQKKLGGGAILELSHELDYLNWILGDWNWIFASNSKVSNLQIDVEDLSIMILGFYGQNSSGEVRGTLSLDLVRRDRTRACTFFGSESSIRWNGIEGTVEVCDNEEGVWKEIFRESEEERDTHLLELQSFFSCVAQNSKFDIEVEDAYKALEMIEAILESSERNQVVFRHKGSVFEAKDFS
jgi:predicted dehydrogenase